jgi:hypothetical protein
MWKLFSDGKILIVFLVRIIEAAGNIFTALYRTNGFKIKDTKKGMAFYETKNSIVCQLFMDIVGNIEGRRIVFAIC